MAISDNIDAIVATIVAELTASGGVPGPTTPISNKVQDLSRQATLGGAKEWVAYMSLFASNASDLAKLMPTDDPTDDPKQEAKAYLVSNGTCGMGTGKNLKNNVTVKLD